MNKPYKVIAEVFTTASGRFLKKATTIYGITGDLPADVIGECVVAAIQKAWNAGHDPLVKPFRVRVTFE